MCKPNLSSSQKALLRSIAGTKRYTLVRLELRSTKESSLRSIALADVHLNQPDESMETVKERAAELRALEQMGLITLDYRPGIVVVSDFDVYMQSAIYRLFLDTVDEVKTRPGTLFDIPLMKKGRVWLTKAGEKLVSDLTKEG